MMTIYIALLGIVPVILTLFVLLPPRKAALYGLVIGYLFMPVVAINVVGLPSYDKVTAVAWAVLLGMLLLDDTGAIYRLRPRWIDLPMAALCIVPFFSAVLNGDTVYDGATAVFDMTSHWGLPYLIGRAYVRDARGMRDLTTVMIVGALLYVPLAWYEMRMSPQLHRMLYSFTPGAFDMTKRWGGWRPLIFMRHGIAVATWLTAGALAAYWLWLTGSKQRVMGLPMAAAAAILTLTTLACRSTQAWGLLALGMLSLTLVKTTRWSGWAVLLVLIPILYMSTRGLGIVSNDSIVAPTAALVGETRASSLEFRLSYEKQLVDRAWERPIYGWGGFGRSLLKTDSSGTADGLNIVDGLWVLFFGKYGMVGLFGLMGALIMPLVALWWRVPARFWTHATVAPAVVVGVIVALWAVDNLLNAMHNPVFLLAAGALASCYDRLVVRQRRLAASAHRRRVRVQSVARKGLAAPPGQGALPPPGPRQTRRRALPRAARASL